MNIFQSQFKTRKEGGFTLVEMIVSLGIFAVVAVVAVGALVKIVSLNRQAESLESAMNDLNFSLDTMTREIRVGNNYDCMSSVVSFNNVTARACEGGGPIIAFNSSKTASNGTGGTCNLIYAYRFDGNSTDGYVLEKAQQNTCSGTISDSSFTPVTSDSVHISKYTMKVYSADSLMPYSGVLLGISGYAGDREQDKQNFNVETFISQRISD